MDYNELYHHGVQGMKWGVRRYQNADGSLTPAGQKRRSLGQVIKDHKTAKKRKAALVKARATRTANQEAAKKRAEDLAKGRIKAKDMTNAELKARMERLQLEKQYKELVSATDNPNSPVSRGKKFVNKFIDSTLDKVADNVLADVTAQALKAGVVNRVNAQLFKGTAEVYTNNKKKS